MAVSNPGSIGSPQKLLQRVQHFIVFHPWACILISLLWVAGSGYGLTRVEFNNDARALFSENNPEMQLLNALETRFTRDDNVVIVVRPHNGDIFTRENLTLLKQLTDKAWTIPKTQRVDSLVNFQHTDVQGDELNVVNLIEHPESLTDTELARIKQIALNEPNLVRNVISAQGHVAAVNVAVLTDDRAGRDAPMIVDYVDAMRNDLRQQYPDVDILISGMAAFKGASQRVTETELSSTSIFSTLAILICLIVMLRSTVSVVLTMTVITFSIVIAMGSVIWAGIEITPVMGGVPAIILTLAVADSIHILMTYQQLIRAGQGKQEAMAESLRVNWQPVYLTSLTTAVGFLCMNTSDSPPFVDMANTVTVGVMAAWFLSAFFLPAMIVVLPRQKYRKEPKQLHFMDAFADWVIDHHKPVFWVSTVLLGMLSAYSLKNQFNDVWLEYFDETYEVRVATDFMVKELTGHHRLQFGIPSGEEAGIMDPEYMQGVDRFVAWARQQHGVQYVASFSDTIKRLNRDMNGGDPAFYRIPEQRELIAQYALMFQLSLPFGLGLENQIDMSQSTTRIDVMLGGVSSNEILAFEQNARHWISENLPARMQSHGVGFDLLLGKLAEQNTSSMLSGMAMALVLVALLMIYSLKSVKYGMLSMLPNLFPSLVSLGVWAMIDGNIGIAVSFVACMTLGIVIDNTVHFLSKYMRIKREKNLDTIEATRYAFKTVGVALFATTLVIAGNFGVMAMSHYYPNSSMGLLTSITVSVALVINFVFFVPLLLFVDAGEKKRAATRNLKLSAESLVS